MKKIFKAMFVMSAITAVVVGVTAFERPIFANNDIAPEIKLDDLKKVVTSKSATIIDANGSGSYKSGHIPGAIHFAKVEETLAMALPKDKSALVIAYCGGPMCTAWEDPAKAAKKLGYTNVKHYKGGIQGWKDAGLAMEK